MCAFTRHLSQTLRKTKWKITLLVQHGPLGYPVINVKSIRTYPTTTSHHSRVKLKTLSQKNRTEITVITAREKEISQ